MYKKRFLEVILLRFCQKQEVITFTYRFKYNTVDYNPLLLPDKLYIDLTE
ncbi:hypothetical protein LX92_04111 [Maribacter polysiphoniae]|uniref:Uncharacterized protein n=1 Tax=Maribacter polysiphoniae TaxID=429344 RepID=A0A316DRR2_9FLAO|nr:hypothetical protein LX92_04111 [Maribacter polysiphoniae]